MRSNPFSTRFIRPGAIPFFFPPSENAPRLIARLGEANWQGEIVGPHGSGKSTLLETLVPVMESAGRKVFRFQLRLGERRIPGLADAAKEWDTTTQVIVDGYEQLSWWGRWDLTRVLRKSGSGLLITTHRTAGLPLMLETQTDQQLAQQLVEHLTTRQKTSQISAETIAKIFAEQQGNMRDTLLALYDFVESEATE